MELALNVIEKNEVDERDWNRDDFFFFFKVFERCNRIVSVLIRYCFLS